MALKPPPEMCAECRFCFGSVILWCGCPASEFYKGPVALDGYCGKFARPIEPPLGLVVPTTEDEADDLMDNGRNTGGKSYFRPGKA